MKKWYVTNTGNDQGLVVDEHTGENIAVTYKKEYARLISQAPAMYETLKEAQARIFMKYGNDELYEKIMGILAAVEGEG
jgi:hypothetical protein